MLPVVSALDIGVKVMPILRFVVCTDGTINVFEKKEFRLHLTHCQLGKLMKTWYGT